MANQKDMVDIGSACEVRIKGARRNIFHNKPLGEFLVELEAALIIGENQRTLRCQPCHGQAYQLAMITLYIQRSFHLFGIGEGRRIEENQIKLCLGCLEPARSEEHTSELQSRPH